MKTKTASYSLEEKSWITYDVANSAFVLILVTAFMPIIFESLTPAGTSAAQATSNWGFGVSASSLILALLSPFLGAVADNRGMKKKLFLLFLLTGVAFTFLLLTVKPGMWLQCIIIFSIAKIGWHGANIFYDAFIVDVTTSKKMDMVSSQGYAWGYIGSVIPFVISIGIIFYIKSLTNDPANIPMTAAKIIYVITGLWWLIFSIPLIKNVKQINFTAKKMSMMASFMRTITTFREIRKFRSAFLFLLAYFFYIDGIDTIISMATSYGTELKLSAITMIAAILMIQLIAFPFAIIYGKLSERFGVKQMIIAGIAVYCIIVILAFSLPSFSSQTKVILFWVLAFLVATSQGGIQALSRSYFGKLIPKKNAAEFFGFYNIFGKFATIMGPALIGIIGKFTGDSRYGVLSLLLLFVTGGILLMKVGNKKTI